MIGAREGAGMNEFIQQQKKNYRKTYEKSFHEIRHIFLYPSNKTTY